MTTTQPHHLSHEDRKALKLIEQIEKKLRENSPPPKSQKPVTS
jgi:hypothetical protein